MDESDREGSYCLDSRFDHGWLLYLYRFINPGTCEVKGEQKMWVVHKRLAELWYKQLKEGALSKEEASEFKLCLDANMRKVQKLAELENLSLIASMTNDTEWQHEICRKIDEFYESMGITVK